MISLHILNCCLDFHIFNRIVKLTSSYLFDIVIWCLIGLLSPLDLAHLSFNILLESLFLHLCCLILLLQSLGLCSDFHKSTSIIIIIFMKLLKFSSLLKECFWGSSTLVFEYLLLFKISTFGSLNKFVSIILISHFEMVKSVGQSLNFFFTFS